MSEMIDSVKDIFKGGGGEKKKKIILFGVAAAAVVGVALYMRSKSGDASIASADTAGTGDDTGGGNVNPQEADLSGLIDGFGSEIDRLDNRIANLGAVGSGYTTLDGSGYVAVPNTDNMAAYSPEPEPMMVSTSTPYESRTLSFAAANGLAEGGDPAIAASNAALIPSTPASVYRAPVAVATVPVPAASFAALHGLAEGGDRAIIPSTPVYHTPAPVYYAPAAETLVVAPKPQNYMPSNVITYVQATPAAIAPKGSSAAATLNNPLAPAGAKMQAAQSVSVKPVQPVAAVKTVAASPTVKVAAASNSNISRFVAAITPKPAPKPAPKPVSAMQSGYNAYMAGR